jgi:hypothetical protein
MKSFAKLFILATSVILVAATLASASELTDAQIENIVKQMQSVKLITLSEFRGGKAKPINDIQFPTVGKKYSVGDNAGMKLNKDGGIEIYIAAKKPSGVPEKNWLPIPRKDEDLSVNLRIYVPDVEKMKAWEAPKAERVGAE